MPCVADPAGRGCAAAGAGAEADEALQFPLDEGSRCRSPGAGERGAAEHAQAGAAAMAGAQAAGGAPGAGVDLAARLVELPEEEPDVCSICLDPYTDSDPAVHTCCKCARRRAAEVPPHAGAAARRTSEALNAARAPRRHCYHLQCVMQWAQRSRECPLCFRALQLQVRPVLST